MFIYTTFLAQLHASYGEAYDVTYHGRHTNDSSFYIEDEMYNKQQGFLLLLILLETLTIYASNKCIWS